MSYQRSDSIAALAAAMAKAQGELAGASKDKTNPHFKSAYADLASVWDACRSALSKNGIAVLQPVSADGPTVTVTTLLTHSSGEWISGDLPMTAQQNTPQGIGSCITYARRYALASMVGVAPEDDDAEAAQGRPANGNGSQRKPAASPVPVGFDEWLIDMESTADEGVDSLKAAWEKSKVEFRKHLTSTAPAAWDSLKKKAALAPRVELPKDRKSA